MEYNITYGDNAENSEVVTLPMAKKNSKIEHAEEDDLLQLILDAAVQEAENYTSTVIRQKSVSVTFSAWANTYVLPVTPVNGVTAVKYNPKTGAEVTLVEGTDYTFYPNAGLAKLQINLESFPTLKKGSAFPITVELDAGYSTANVPAFVKAAILLRFSHKELYREDTPTPTSMDRTFYSALRSIKQW